MLRATKTAQVRGKARSFAMDWLLFEPSPAEATTAPRRIAVEQASVGGVDRRAIVVAPGAQVDWFVEVPEDGTLVFGSGLGSRVPARSRCRSTATGPPGRLGASTPEVMERSTGLFEAASLDKIVRVRFRNEASTDLALSDVRVARRVGGRSSRSTSQPATSSSCSSTLCARASCRPTTPRLV